MSEKFGGKDKSVKHPGNKHDNKQTNKDVDDGAGFGYTRRLLRTRTSDVSNREAGDGQVGVRFLRLTDDSAVVYFSEGLGSLSLITADVTAINTRVCRRHGRNSGAWPGGRAWTPQD